MPIEKIGTVTSKSVEKHTGKSWDEWVALLDKAHARKLAYRELTALLKTKFKQKPWWQQVVAIGYETHTGKRLEGQNQKGEYSVTVTATLDVSERELWKLMLSPAGQKVWLGSFEPIELKKDHVFECDSGAYGQVRTFKAPTRLRLSWHRPEWIKPSVVQIYFLKRPKGRSCLVFMHEALASPTIREQVRAHWKTAFDRLKDWLEKQA